jgi:DNA-nicking Smr family endonuclease
MRKNDRSHKYFIFVNTYLILKLCLILCIKVNNVTYIVIMSDPTDSELADFLLWKEFTKDIDPVRQMDWGSEQDKISTKDNKDNKEHKLKNMAAESIPVTVKSLEKTPVQAIHFQLDRRTDEKLRKGKMPIDGTLDLHGLNQTQAHAALENAVLRAAAQQKRCLLIITGKGKTGKSGDDWLTPSAGILKTRVPQWLSVSPLSYHVLKYTQAQPQHGGSGALYVYLRRQR